MYSRSPYNFPFCTVSMVRERIYICMVVRNGKILVNLFHLLWFAVIPVDMVA